MYRAEGSAMYLKVGLWRLVGSLSLIRNKPKLPVWLSQHRDGEANEWTPQATGPLPSAATGPVCTCGVVWKRAVANRQTKGHAAICPLNDRLRKQVEMNEDCGEE